MSKKRDLDPGLSREVHDNDNDNDASKKVPVIVPPAGGLFAYAVSATAITTMLAGVDMTGGSGRSGVPTMLFKARAEDGTYMYGQRKTKPEPGSRWAANPMSFQRGWVCFDDNNNWLDEKLLPVSKPLLDPATLPDKGFPWQRQWAVGLKCVSGIDAGVEVVFKGATEGVVAAISGLFEIVRDRALGGQHDDKLVAILGLDKGSYPHPKHGRTVIPVLTLHDWALMDGPAPAPVASSPQPPVEPSRRRRAG